MEPTQTNDPQQPQGQLPPTPPPAPPVASYRRSPGLAVVLSFFPGLGHLYLGMYQRAIGLAAAFFAAIWLTDHVDAVGVVVAFIWFFGLIDAYRQTQFINQGLAPESVFGGAVAKPTRRSGALGLGIFLTVLGLILLYNQFYPLDLDFLADWWPLVLVAIGVYILAKHFVQQKKLRDAQRQTGDEAWPSSP